MSSREQLIRARLAILAMAIELKNVARACRVAGMSRSQFYALKKAYAVSGKDGFAPRVRRTSQGANRTPDAIEAQILLKTHANPTVSYVRLAERMMREGTMITAATVRYVWKRHGLSTRSARLRWIKRNGAGTAPSVRNSLTRVFHAEPSAPLLTAGSQERKLDQPRADQNV